LLQHGGARRDSVGKAPTGTSNPVEQLAHVCESG